MSKFYIPSAHTTPSPNQKETKQHKSTLDSKVLARGEKQKLHRMVKQKDREEMERYRLNGKNKLIETVDLLNLPEFAGQID